MNPFTWGRDITWRIPREEVPAEVLALLVKRDGPGCAVCNRQGLTPPAGEPIELDHKQPLSLGGNYHWENLQLCCRAHNRGRGNRPAHTVTEPTWLRRQRRGRE